MAGKLYIVSTPIGNLGDMTKRAMEVLAAADYIAAEDTRRTLALLNSLGIGGRLLSCHEPVSYTHLDVYKRQRYYSINQFFIFDIISMLKKAGAGLGEIKEYIARRSPEAFMQLLEEKHAYLVREQREICLLYTSRCV